MTFFTRLRSINFFESKLARFRAAKIWLHTKTLKLFYFDRLIFFYSQRRQNLLTTSSTICDQIGLTIASEAIGCIYTQMLNQKIENLCDSNGEPKKVTKEMDLTYVKLR